MIAVLLLVAAPGSAWAQAPARSAATLDSLRRVLAADSLRHAMTADSLRRVARTDSVARAAADPVRLMNADSAAVARRAIDLRRGRPVKKPFDEPRWVMLRSLAVPGWGQLYNRSWIKALLVAGVEVQMGSKVVDDLRALNRIQGLVDAARRAQDPEAEAARVNDYNVRLDQLTRREWWLGAAVAYALLDAYIDAHFRNFEAEFKYDPALPGGDPSARVRLSYRWSF